MNHTFLKIANAVLILGTLVGIVYPAFIEGQGISGTLQVYFTPDWTQGFVMRWLVALFFLSCLYVVSVDRAYRRIPLTVISTRIKIKFHQPDGSHVEISRSQLLRANKRNVTAYYSSHKPNSPTGRLPLSEVSHSTYCEHCDLNDSVEVHGSDTKGYDFMHIFGRPLPFSEYMPLIPVYFMDRDYDKLPKFLQKNLVLRRQSVNYHNEFNVDNPIMVLSATNYQQLNVHISILFDIAIPRTLKVRRVQNVGVLDIHPELFPEQRTAKFRIRRFKNEKIRINWASSENYPRDV